MVTEVTTWKPSPRPEELPSPASTIGGLKTSSQQGFPGAYPASSEDQKSIASLNVGWPDSTLVHSPLVTCCGEPSLIKLLDEMAFRALLFSKSPETNSALTSACKSAGIRLEVCDDIFSAMEKGTKRSFSCILVNWSDQPEAGFLLKRARESGPNKNLIAIAIVENDPTAAEMRDHRLDFLIYRPVAEGEAREVLAKASQKMEPASSENGADSPAAGEPRDEQPLDAAASTLAASSSAQSEGSHQKSDTTNSVETSVADGSGEGELESGEEESHGHNYALIFRNACAVALVLTAALSLWRTRDAIVYLARTREGRFTVLRESVAALFYLNPSGAMPVGAASTDAQQDAYFSRTADNSAAKPPQIGVVATEADLSASPMELRKAADFPLPTPVYEHPAPEPVHTRAPSAGIPESLRSSAPITPPVVVTVNPAQMMPVAAPAVPPMSTQSLNEPLTVSEEAERALLVQSVNPVYPPEALPQKLHGRVVLQATIGRDGSVEDLKLVRGYFVLGKAAIAAVRQWRFQPYTFNGRPAETQTVITINFSYPPS